MMLKAPFDLAAVQPEPKEQMSMILNDKPKPYRVELYDTSNDQDIPRTVKEIGADTAAEARRIAHREAKHHNDLIQIVQLLDIHLEELEPGIEQWTYDNWQYLD